MPNNVMLITGTSKGIGKFLAHYYVSCGYTVIGCSRTQPEWELQNYTHINADITNEAYVKAVFKTIKTRYGRLDVLINNAGIAAMNHALLTPLTTVNKILSTNVSGTFLFCREAAKLMQKNNTGRIVNFTTVAVPLLLEGEAIYAASKSAVITLTQILARELSSMNITINAIGPTPIDTDLIRSVAADKIESLIKRQAIQRKGTFSDVANVIDFFINKLSDFITGQTLYLGGVA